MTNRRPYGLLGKLPSQASNHAALVSEPRENTADARDIRAAVFLPEPVSESRTQLEAVATEVRFAKSLKHENVIRTFGLESFHCGWARIVEYVDGEPLSALIQSAQENEVTVPIPFASRILLDLCAGSGHAYSALSDASSSQLRVHGGLRPDTVMVSFAGVAKLTGYGASTLGAQNKAEINSYQAPEQVIGGSQAATESSDVYALGAILYTLLTGAAPYAGEEDLEDAIMTTTPSRPELEGVGAELIDIALKAMSKRVQKRFESVEDLRVAIERVAKDQVASTELISVFIDDLIPPESMERSERTALLARQDDLSLQTKLEYCDVDQWNETVFQEARVSIVEGDPTELDQADNEDEEPIDQRSQETMVVKRPASKETPAIVDDSEEQSDDDSEDSPPLTDEQQDSPPLTDEQQDSAEKSQPPEEAEEASQGQQEDEPSENSPSEPAEESHEAANDLSLEPEDSQAENEDAASNAEDASSVAPSPDEKDEELAEPESDVQPEEPQEESHDESQEEVQQDELDHSDEAADLSTSASSEESAPTLAEETIPDDSSSPMVSEEPKPEPKLDSTPPKRQAPDRAATEIATPPKKKQIHVTIGPSAAHETTSRIPGRGFSRPDGDQWKNDSGLPAAVPRAPIRDDSITAFRKNVGDNSRSMLFVLLLMAGGILFSVYYFGKEAAPELSEGNQRQISYKEIAEITQDGQKAPNQRQKPQLVAPTEDPQAADAENEMVDGDVLQEATFELSSVPELSASTHFDTEELDFGRTPISVKLKPGKYRIRLTDEEKRINVYREFEIKGGGVYREKIELLPGSLTIRARKGAELEVDGVVAGKAPIKPLELYEGKHRIKMTHKGKSKVRWIEMAPGAKLKVNFLKKK